MQTLEGISLAPATSADVALLSNLLELYVHDLSGVFPNVKLGADGRFGYPKLPLYLTEDERRFAFLIRCNTDVAGFALVTRGSPVSDDPDTFDVAEFFILRKHRRSGVGRQAAFLLWNRFAGKWTVRALRRNAAAVDFWRRSVADFTHGAGVECELPSELNAWRVFAFESIPGQESCVITAHPS